MRQIALVEDRLTKQPFAVLVLSGEKTIAFGASGQGEVWAQWANSENMSLEQMQGSLDITLMVNEPKDIKEIDIDTYKENFTDNTFADLKNEISKKALLKIIETKSIPPFFPIGDSSDSEFNIEDDYSEEESILNWPITDIGIAQIDVAYKQIAINYKTKAFQNDINVSSMALKVKGVRAVWDAAIPGGGGWRCPEDTPFGGQFTNRLGIGCTFGMMRRLGQGLTGASLRDLQKLNNDPNNIDKPMLYRVGQRLENSAEQRRVARVQKFERRVNRRADKLAEAAAKEKLRQGAPTARQIYSSLNPDMTRRDRARIAAGTVVARIGNDMRTSGFNASMGRRAARRIPTDVNASVKDEKFTLDKDIPEINRIRGGRLPKSISSYGITHGGRGSYQDYDEMWHAADLLWSKPGRKAPDPTNLDGNGLDIDSIPAFLTPSEYLRLETIIDNHLDGTNRQPRTVQEVLDKNKELAQGSFEHLTRKEADKFLSAANAPNRVQARPEWRVPDELRDNGGHLPAGIADNGVWHSEATGVMIDGQKMVSTSDLWDDEKRRITKKFGYLPNYITPNERQGMLKGATYREFLDEFVESEGGRKLNPFDKNDAALMGEEARNALLNTNAGRNGPSKRAIIAARLRNTAENLRAPESRRLARRATKNTIKEKPKKPISSVFVNATVPQIAKTDLKSELSNWNEATHEYTLAKGMVNDAVRKLGIPFLSTDDAAAQAAQFNKLTPRTFYGELSDWDSAYPDRALQLGETLTNNFLNDPDGFTTVSRTHLRTYGGVPFKEEITVGQTKFGAARIITYRLFQPKNHTADLGIRAELATGGILPPGNPRTPLSEYDPATAEGARILARFRLTTDPANWHEIGVITMHLDGNQVLQLQHEGSNPLFSWGLLDDTNNGSFPHIKFTDNTGNTANGIAGSMATYTTERGLMWLDEPVEDNKKKRKRRGNKPEKPGIVSRFGDSFRLFTPENEETRAFREVVGRRPRPTGTRRERSANAMRRLASRLRFEDVPDNTLDMNEYAARIRQQYPSIRMINVPGGPVGQNSIQPRHFFNGDSRIHPLLRNLPAPAGRLNSDWIRDESIFDGLRELNALLTDADRTPLLPDSLDEANQEQLGKLVEEWSKLFNDDNNPIPSGAVSNFGKLTENINSEGTFKYDSSKPNEPIVYVEDAAGKTAHFLSPDGHHILSAVTVTDDQGNDEIRYVASAYTKQQIAQAENQGKTKPSFIQRIAGKFRRPKKEKPAPTTTSVRARSRALVFNPAASGLRFNRTTTGPLLPDQAFLSNLEKVRLDTVLQKELDYHAKRFAKALGKSDKDQLLESELLDWIDNLKKTDSRRAGIEETNLHNFIVLSQYDASKDLGYVNNLKPSLRERVMTNANIVNNSVDPKRRRPFTPYGPNSGYPRTPVPTPQPRPAPSAPTPSAPTPSAPTTPSVVPTPSAPTIPSPPPVRPTSPVVAPTARVPRKATGPQLTPGVGNSALGIVFDAKSGLYIDNNTGEFVEDLSGLPIDQHAIYTPQPLSLNTRAPGGPEFPEIPVNPALPIQKGAKVEIVAPGMDPNTPELAITAQPLSPSSSKHRSGVVSTFAKALKSRFAESAAKPTRAMVQSTQNNANRIEHIDISGIPGVSAYGSPGIPWTQILKADVERITENAAATNELLSTLTTFLSNSAGNEFLSTYEKTRTMEELGLDANLPVREFYNFESRFRISQQGHHMEDAYRKLNRALQLEHVVQNPNPTATQSELDDIRQQRDAAWSAASAALSAAHKLEVSSRDNHLDTWRNLTETNAPKGRISKSADEYIVAGANAERLEYLLNTHIVNNNTALDAIEQSKRSEMQESAKRRNERARRIAARAASGASRNVGLYDDQPDILDPYSSANPPTSPRQAVELERIRDEHRAQTMFDRITQGAPAPLTDEQMDYFIALGDVYQQAQNNPTNANGAVTVIGPPNTPIAGMIFEASRMEAAQRAHLALTWYYNGFASRPVLASKQELIDALKETDADGNPKYVLATRGVQGLTAAAELQMSADALTGDRFIPGAGGTAAGTGEYWTQKPSAWSSYHGGKGGTTITLFSRDSRLANRNMFGELFGNSNSTITYESLWSLYNALGAPRSTGTNPSHGPFARFGVPVDSLKPDPNTGVLNAQQIKDLRDHIDRLTQAGTPHIPGQKPDSTWGIATLEGLYRDGSLSNGLATALFPANFASLPQAEQDEIIETREYYNAWINQFMTMTADMVERLQDEVKGGQAAKDANNQIWSAVRSLLYMRTENMATLMGYDGFVADGVKSTEVTPSQIWKALVEGRASRFTMLNRSGMIMEDTPSKHYRDWTPIIRSITYPDGSTAERNYGDWN